MGNTADDLNGGTSTEDTIDGDAAADASNHQEAATETGSMSADTAALGGGAIAGADEDVETVTDADGGAR